MLKIFYRRLYPSFQAVRKLPIVQNCQLNNLANAKQDRLIWVDLEMTGLDENTCHILEIACVITDGDLDVVAEAPSIVVHQDNDILDNMNAWCMKQHSNSGLTEAVKASKISLAEAEKSVLQFVQQHTFPRTSPLAGNSVYIDRKFLEKYMPQFVNHLHYRIIDVSTIKELSKRWYSINYRKTAAIESSRHRALDDIKASIHELRYYRLNIFR